MMPWFEYMKWQTYRLVYITNWINEQNHEYLNKLTSELPNEW